MPPISRGAPRVRRKMRQLVSSGPRSRSRKASAWPSVYGQGAWAGLFLPGFHPWKHDDRHLIEKAERSLKAREEAYA